MAAECRALDARWDDVRAARIRSQVRAKHASGERRDRAVRRALSVAGSAAVLFFGILRGATSVPSTLALAPEASLASDRGSAVNALATRTLDDAGYARD